MNDLVQIESAVAELSPQDQWSLLTWLQSRLTSAPSSTVSTPDGLKMFRQLQNEVRLTKEDAQAWKEAVADSRR